MEKRNCRICGKEVIVGITNEEHTAGIVAEAGKLASKKYGIVTVCYKCVPIGKGFMATCAAIRKADKRVEVE